MKQFVPDKVFGIHDRCGGSIFLWPGAVITAFSSKPGQQGRRWYDALSCLQWRSDHTGQQWGEDFLTLQNSELCRYTAELKKEVVMIICRRRLWTACRSKIWHPYRKYCFKWVKQYNSHEELTDSGKTGGYLMTKDIKRRKTTMEKRSEVWKAESWKPSAQGGEEETAGTMTSTNLSAERQSKSTPGILTWDTDGSGCKTSLPFWQGLPVHFQNLPAENIRQKKLLEAA